MSSLLTEPHQGRPRELGGRLVERLSEGRDSASLGFFRIGFGAILVWEVWRKYDLGILRRAYIEPDNHFTWWLFDWVKPHHGTGLYIAFVILALAAFSLALGLFYRASAVILWAGLTYWFLLDKTQYINHHYLAVLIAFLLILVPAHAAYSVDGKRRQVQSPTVPAWSLWLVRFQVGVPYFFAGLAKLNYDWFVRGVPIRGWMAGNVDFPIIGRFFTQEVVVRSFAWGSTLFDLSVPFLLLHRRTRVPAFAVALTFHFMNARMFGLGMFPWLMIVATTIFLEPDWPRRMGAVLRRGMMWERAVVVTGAGAGFAIGGFPPVGFSAVKALVGATGVAVLFFHLLPTRSRADGRQDRPDRAPERFVVRPALALFLATWVAVQILLPLRHYAIPGNTNWTEEGNRFAWHLLLKHSEVRLTFRVTDPATGETWVEDPRRHVNQTQLVRLKTPDLILHLAHHIKAYYLDRAGGDLAIRVDAVKTMNLRPVQLLIDPTVDLTKVRRPYVPPAEWIVPLEPYRAR